jgi:polyisoprenoid-binding protein YceI
MPVGPRRALLRTSPHPPVLRTPSVSTALFAALMALATSLGPANAQGIYVLDRSTSQVTFRAQALANKLTGRSENLRGLVRLQGVDLRHLYGSVSFPVASLRMDSPAQEREVAKLLGAPGEPEIVFDIDSVAPDSAASQRWSFFGRLTMRGVTRPVRFSGAARAVGVRVHTHGMAAVDIRDWGITPPSRLLGLIRMSPTVRLSFDAEFARQPHVMTTDIAERREPCDADRDACRSSPR